MAVEPLGFYFGPRVNGSEQRETGSPRLVAAAHHNLFTVTLTSC